MSDDACRAERAACCRRPHARAADQPQELRQSQDDEDEGEYRWNGAAAHLILRLAQHERGEHRREGRRGGGKEDAQQGVEGERDEREHKGDPQARAVGGGQGAHQRRERGQGVEGRGVRAEVVDGKERTLREREAVGVNDQRGQVTVHVHVAARGQRPSPVEGQSEGHRQAQQERGGHALAIGAELQRPTAQAPGHHQRDGEDHAVGDARQGKPGDA